MPLLPAIFQNLLPWCGYPAPFMLIPTGLVHFIGHGERHHWLYASHKQSCSHCGGYLEMDSGEGRDGKTQSGLTQVESSVTTLATQLGKVSLQLSFHYVKLILQSYSIYQMPHLGEKIPNSFIFFPLGKLSILGMCNIVCVCDVIILFVSVIEKLSFLLNIFLTGQSVPVLQE